MEIDEIRHKIVNPICQIEATMIRRLSGYPEYERTKESFEKLRKQVSALISFIEDVNIKLKEESK